jgi:hypothetical protein
MTGYQACTHALGHTHTHTPPIDAHTHLERLVELVDGVLDERSLGLDLTNLLLCGVGIHTHTTHTQGTHIKAG